MTETDSPKIAILLAQMTGAGIQRMRINLALELIQRGYDVEIAVGQRGGALGNVVPASLKVFEIAPKGPIWYFFGLLRYLKTRRPDYLLSSYEDISAIAILVNRLLGSPAFVLVSTHNALSKVRMEGEKTRRLKNWILHWGIGRLYRKADGLVAVSEGVASEVSEMIGVSADRVRIIYNPVIRSDFERLVTSSIEDDVRRVFAKPVIGYFGRLHSQKRVDLLLRAFRQLQSSQPCRLLIVGEGEEEDRLKRFSGELEIASKVFFYGYSHNPFPLMKRCSVVILPSDYEGLGNVLIEALACGTQVISTDCPYGPAEILAQGKWGQLVPVGDVDGLVTAMERSLNRTFWVEPEKLKTHSQQFSAETAAQQYLEVLGLV